MKVKKIRDLSLSYISDIHLERRQNFPKFTETSGNDLVLAGDIGNPFKENYKEFLMHCSYNFPRIFLISGNHEYYNHGRSNHKSSASDKIQKTEEKIRNIVNKLSNVDFLQRDVIEVSDKYVMGCTLWSNIFNKNTKNWKFLNSLHRRDVKWLEESLKKYNNKNIVVITHHLPTYKLRHPKYEHWQHQDRYYTNLEYLIKPPIAGWIGGHSHCKMNILVNSVPLMVNSFS